MDTIGKHLADVEEAMTLLDQGEVEQMVAMLKVVGKLGGAVYLFGNGGSHTTAMHFANDLVKVVGIRAVCVGEMSATVFAYGNDTGWNNMFKGPLEKLLKPIDGVVGISCRGGSANVLTALEYARGNGNLAVGMTGLGDGTPINRIGLDALVHVRSGDIRVQEDVHLMVCHAVVRALQEER